MPYLLALFVLASGITIVQVIANPLILMLGAAPTALSRLILAQAFNSLGTTIFPFLGSIVILGSLSSVDPATLSAAAHTLYRSQAAHVISATYLGLAVLLLALAAMLWPQRHRLAESRRPRTGLLGSFSLLARPRFAFGAACIFLYVGAEVAIGSVIVNYLMQASVLGLATEQAGKHVPYYWGGAMVGRFIGAYLLRLDSPGRVLSSVAASAIALLLVSANSSGALAGYALLAIGLFNSIMFPTIFSLASEGLGPRAAEGSGIICMATVGGAIVPLLTGRAADLAGLRMALLVPAICYAGILCFGLYVRRPLLSA
jgi:FHS family L-fucose permease-like MFS transporter